jgi:hypothetical protein
MALPLVAITGKVVTPDGSSVTGGDIQIELSSPGSAGEAMSDNERAVSLAELRCIASENFDYAAMARFYAFRMRTVDAAIALHDFATLSFFEAMAFSRAVEQASSPEA